MTLRTYTAEAQRAREGTQRETHNRITRQIIGAAIEVHRVLGPGLLESLYESALAFELAERGIAFQRQVELPLRYKDHSLEGHLRLDLVVADLVIVEIKSVECVLDVHEAQLLSYLRLADKRLRLLINFNTVTLRNGIRRFANRL